MWADPFTAFGTMSIPFLASNLITFLLFVAVTILGIVFTFKYYEGRSTPMKWILIIIGFSAISLSELGQFLIPYRVEPTYMEFLIILLIQSIGIILLALGCFMIYRGVSK